jgi:ribosome-associated toxin RatA of RatAB toxin-antitoxin module
MAIFSRVQVDERKKTLPLSSAHSIIETHKKYMKAILDMKNNGEPMTYITFKGSVPDKHNTTKLPNDHPFKVDKYIFDYMKEGTPYV